MDQFDPAGPGTEREAGRLYRPAGLAQPIRFVGAGDVVAHLRRVTRGWEIAPAEPGPDLPCITVTGGRGGYRLDSHWLDTPSTDLTAVAATCGLAVDMVLGLLDAQREMIALHCGAIEIGGRLVVLAAQSRVGESTLVGRLSAEKVAVFGDDILPIGGPDDLGFALGIAPRLRLPLPPRASARFAAHVAATCAASDGRYGYLMTDNLAPHGTRAPIGAVLLLDRRRRGPARLRTADRAEAMRLLLLRNLTEDRDPEPLFARLDALMDRAPVTWLEYSDLEDATALILERFSDWSRPAEPLPARPARQARQARRGKAAPVLSAMRVRPRPGTRTRRIDGELFLCDTAERAILHLNPIGAAVWGLLEEGSSPAEAAVLLGEAFPDVPPPASPPTSRACSTTSRRQGCCPRSRATPDPPP